MSRGLDLVQGVPPLERFQTQTHLCFTCMPVKNHCSPTGALELQVTWEQPGVGESLM